VEPERRRSGRCCDQRPDVDAVHGIIATAVASYSGLSEPMLARSGRLPTSGDYAYELKWDRVPRDRLALARDRLTSLACGS
jgi:hypothetical protein